MFEIQEHPGVARVLATGRPGAPWNDKKLDEDAVFVARRERMLFPEKGGSPCESCWRMAVCENGCDLWRSYYLQRQRAINAYARAAYRGKKESGRDVFAYSHPDLVRRYEKTHPCGGCGLKPGCNVPCSRYIHWYDFRMAQARKRLGS